MPFSQYISFIGSDNIWDAGYSRKKVVISPFGYNDSVWDPSRGKFLPLFYNADDMRGKSVAKVALLQQTNLPVDHLFLLVTLNYYFISI